MTVYEALNEKERAAANVVAPSSGVASVLPGAGLRTPVILDMGGAGVDEKAGAGAIETARAGAIEGQELRPALRPITYREWLKMPVNAAADYIEALQSTFHATRADIAKWWHVEYRNFCARCWDRGLPTPPNNRPAPLSVEAWEAFQRGEWTEAPAPEAEEAQERERPVITFYGLPLADIAVKITALAEIDSSDDLYCVTITKV